MKKYFNLSLAAIITTAMLWSCKKDSTSKDYAALFNNTVWTGEFHYTTKISQPFSIEFKPGGQLIWNEIAGEFTAIWKLENGKITVNFPSTNGFTADITNDDKLTNMQSIGSSWLLDHAELNTTPDESLDNTKWKTTNLLFTFRAPDKADINVGPLATSVFHYNNVYIRRGKSIRITYPQHTFFNVIVNSTTMIGVDKPAGATDLYAYKVTKQ